MSFSLESWKTEIAHYFNAQAAHLRASNLNRLCALSNINVTPGGHAGPPLHQ